MNSVTDPMVQEWLRLSSSGDQMGIMKLMSQMNPAQLQAAMSMALGSFPDAKQAMGQAMGSATQMYNAFAQHTAAKSGQPYNPINPQEVPSFVGSMINVTPNGGSTS